MNSNGHILWVDDEIHHLKPHILFLETKGYKVSTATNGNDAEILNKNNNYLSNIKDFGVLGEVISAGGLFPYAKKMKIY